jgi:hypothetical protein
LSDGHPIHFDKQRIQRKLGSDRAVEDAMPSIFEVEVPHVKRLVVDIPGADPQPGHEKRVANDMAT